MTEAFLLGFIDFGENKLPDELADEMFGFPPEDPARFTSVKPGSCLKSLCASRDPEELPS